MCKLPKSFPTAVSHERDDWTGKIEEEKEEVDVEGVVEIGNGSNLKDSLVPEVGDSIVSVELSEEERTSDFLKVLGRAETESEKGTWIGAGAGAEISTGVLA